jgi:amino acid adenylation domain-containing protein
LRSNKQHAVVWRDGGTEHTTLASGFLAASERFPERAALAIDGREVIYAELRDHATAIASTLEREPGGGPLLTAVMAGRSAGTFAAILGILLRGHGYVPLNPRYPDSRNCEILQRSGSRALVVDSAFADAARAATARLEDPPLLLLTDDARPDSSFEVREPSADDPAYLLFTSGSTGRPKGVLVTQANVRAFLAALDERYDLDETDRISQLFDLTFDLSVFDMFVAWERGACVCCPDEKHLLEPSGFVREAALTVWFSVPSVAMLMQRFGALKAKSFPDLRLSLFCGEALPADLAAAWAAAAPNSVLENLYGPTEATIACTAQRWTSDCASRANGLVPIGRPFGKTLTRVVDDSLGEVPPGETGQLVLAGPQVVGGYFDDEHETERAFVTLPKLGRGYLTGDRVREPSPNAPLEFLGRLDSQIKVLGHRVELGEVEAVLREEAGADVVAVGWPRTDSGVAGVVAFIANTSLDRVALRQALAARLPDYMIPRDFHLVPELPLNPNGKHDRKALIALLESP